MFENRAFFESDVILKSITEAKEWQVVQSLGLMVQTSQEQRPPLQGSLSEYVLFYGYSLASEHLELWNGHPVQIIH